MNRIDELWLEEGFHAPPRTGSRRRRAPPSALDAAIIGSPEQAIFGLLGLMLGSECGAFWFRVILLAMGTCFLLGFVAKSFSRHSREYDKVLRWFAVSSSSVGITAVAAIPLVLLFRLDG